MARTLVLTLITMVLLTKTRSMIMRNNALMTKMVSQFHGKEDIEPRIRDRDQSMSQRESTRNREDAQEDGLGSPEHVLSLMQNVLCKNFPSIPCEVITKDEALKRLIEKSVQQLKYKKMSLERSTTPPKHHQQLTFFPMINSEDLSNFLQVSNTGTFKEKKKTKKRGQEKNHWSHENKPKSKTSTTYNGRKKIRKFYPHKIKYKEKNEKGDFADYSDEKLSMSVEMPRDHGAHKKHFSYRRDPSDPPVWRIDYMKHGEPSLNMFGYDTDSLKGKIVKTGPNVIVDENILEQAVRQDVLHPDVYIKKNYPRKITGENNSEAMD